MTEILTGIKENSRTIKNNVVEMTTIFYGLILGLNIVKRRIRKIENDLIEISQTRSQR